MTSSDKMNEVLSKLELLYGAGLDIDEYTAFTVSEVVDAALEDLESYQDDLHFKNLQGKAEILVKEIAWISALAYYMGDSVVIFDNFPNTPEISIILLSFTKLTYVDSINDAVYKKLIANMIFIDEEHVEFRFSNAYRCIKLVIMMILYGSSTQASILCRFILHQMGVSIGLR